MVTQKIIDGPLQYKDIWFDEIPLNDWTNELRCFVTNVDGWWGPPEASVPVDERPYTEDGNYLVPGRNLARVVEIDGVCLPSPMYMGSIEGQNNVAAWRDTLVKKLNKVRETGTLTFYEESGTKQLEVQVRERPIFNFEDNNQDIIKYNIVFYAADPAKYNSTLSKQTVKVTEKPSDIFNPDDPDAEKITSTGRTYHDVKIGENYYAAFPRTYNQTSLWWDDKDSRYLSKITVNNEGNTDTYGSIVMRGPVTNPAVKHLEQGKVMQLNMEITSDQTVTIDLKDKTALLNDGTSVLANLDFSSQWFFFTPGINTLTFFGDDITLEQIGWASATNYVKNPSAEYSSGLPSYVAATNLINQYKEVNVVQEHITNYATVVDSSLADETPSPSVLSTSKVTATISSWFGSDYNESDKSIKILPNVIGDTSTYVTLKSDLKVGPVVFSAVLASSIFSENPRGTNTKCLELSYNTPSGSTVSMLGTPNTEGYAEIITTIPATASNVSYKIINGYSVDTAINPGTGVYEKLSNAIYAKNLYIGSQVLPDNIVNIPQSIPYYKGDMYETTNPLTLEFISRFENNIHTVGTSEIKINSDFYQVPNATVEELTVLYSLTMPVPTQTTVILRDPTGEALDISYPLQSIKANTKTNIHAIMDKPLGDFEIYILISPSVASIPVRGTLSEVALVNGRYYGHYFDNDQMGLTDSALQIGEYTNIIRFAPYQYTPVLAAVDDLEEKPSANNARRSSMYAYEGGYSIALNSPPADIDGFVESVRVDCINWSDVPNGLVTIYTNINTAGNTFMPYTNSRCIGVLTDNGAIYSEQAPLDDNNHQLVLKFTKTNNNIKLYLLGGATGYSETFFDGIMVVSGDYNDRYFNGGLELASWAGTPHNSISQQTARPYIKGAVSEVYFRDAWIT